MSDFGYLYDWEDEDPGVAVEFNPSTVLTVAIFAAILIGWFFA